MGANAVRLVRTDHRRIGDLVRRLGRPYRAGESLRLQAVAELRAHVEATREVLLPFAAERVEGFGEAVVEHDRLLDDLLAGAAPVEASQDPVPAPLVAALAEHWAHHLGVEEALLTRLEGSIEVARLRVLGDALRRRRDATLRAALRGTSRLRRPVATRAELYEKARRLQIEGRSGMSRAELQEAVDEHTRR